MNNTAPAAKKKIQPYPIDASLDAQGVKKTLEILQMNEKGFIAKLKVGLVQVGEYYQAQFNLPVSRASVQASIRVLKTYDRPLDAQAKVVERLAEFHFHNLPAGPKATIDKFLGLEEVKDAAKMQTIKQQQAAQKPSK